MQETNEVQEYLRREKAKITLVSPASIREGGAHDVVVKNTSIHAE